MNEYSEYHNGFLVTVRWDTEEGLKKLLQGIENLTPKPTKNDMVNSLVSHIVTAQPALLAYPDGLTSIHRVIGEWMTLYSLDPEVILSKDDKGVTPL